MKILFKSGIGAVCAMFFMTSLGFCGTPLRRVEFISQQNLIMMNQPELLKLSAQETPFPVVVKSSVTIVKSQLKKKSIWHFDKGCMVVEEETTFFETCEMSCTETFYADEQPQPGDYDYEEPDWYDEDDSEYDGNCIRSECGGIDIIDDLTDIRCVKPGQADKCDSISETYREEEPRYCVENCCSEWDKRGSCLDEICCKWESIEILTTTCVKEAVKKDVKKKQVAPVQ